jgi:TPR repeat protein
MNRAFQSFTDASVQPPRSAAARSSANASPPKRGASKIFSALILIFTATMNPACADGLVRGKSPYYRGNYAHAARELIPAAARGNARAQAQLGFMYENGFGVPQNYVAAADLYQSSAAQGNSFAQSRLGLSYDKGHGVPQSVILSYAWLNLAAAGASGRERDFYHRLRDAVASKMTFAQIAEGQRLALIWAPVAW